MASPRAHESHDPWLAALEGHKLRTLIGARALEQALASEAAYIEPPSLCAEGVIAAVEEKGVDGGVKIILRGPDSGSLAGSCSRCTLAFGPCVHMGIVAVDLALSARLRTALLEGDFTHDAAEESPRLRRGVRLERIFENSLAAWLVPARDAEEDAEISAAPLADSEVHVARGYSDRVTASPTAAIAIFVRRKGERRQLTPKEIVSLETFSARDRQVIVHARDRGAGRKSAFSSGAEASIAIEAMRVHGGVFAAGYKGRLNFRGSVVRPAVRVAAVGEAPRGFESLTAYWTTEDGAATIAFAESTLFVGPFPYVWAQNGSIYRIARDVDLAVAQGFLRIPTLHVPAGRMKDAGARLLHATRGRGISLPTPETFGLPPIERPRIVLRLEGEPLAMGGDAFAVYTSGEHSLFAGASTPQSQEGRDLECEARARELLVNAKLLRPALASVGLDESIAGEEEDDSDDEENVAHLHPRSPITAAGARALFFWQQGLAELKAARDPSFEVELTPKLARVHIGSPITAKVHVALDGHWLKTRLDFRSEELPVELARIREALLKKRRWIALDDGTLARISGSVAALAEEASRVFAKGENESLLAPHQLGRLDRWIEDHDGRIDAAVIALRRKLRTLAVADEPVMPKKLNATLRPYQKRGLAWLQFLDTLGAGGILADDMGLGKTITALTYLLEKKQREGSAPSLVVCPTSVATNWIREAERFTPQLNVALMHGASRDKVDMSKYDLVVTTYAIMRLDVDVLAKTRFRCVILDEAQNIKNASSATTRAAHRLDATMRLALSGTPMENRLSELWSLASFANPGILGTVSDFGTRYENPIVADRASPIAAELRSILRPFLLRRTKAEVLTDLPPKTEIDRVVSLSTPDKRMYDALALTLRESVQKDFENKNGIPSISVFAALTRLRQMACDPRLVDKRVSNDDAGAKREAFLELVRELVAEGRRALVFSQFVSLLTLWRRDLDAENIAYEYLDGSTTHRDDAVARFQEGTAPLFLISLKAGGSGLNLTAADTVIHCDPWWNPAVEDQATDRAHRIGQDKPVTVVRLVARGTIEEKILALKAKKRALASAVIGGDASALGGISAEDLRMLLGVVEDDTALGDANDEERELAGATDMIATVDRIVDPVYSEIVRRVQRWSRESGRKESELATLLDIPHAFAARLVRGEPFPCTRLMGERIRRRIHEWK